MGGKLEIQSLHRALDLLETIYDSPSPLNLRELTDKIGLPRTTVYRLLRNLESRNYLSCDNNGGYQLGVRMLVMSQGAQKMMTLKKLARATLETLSSLSKETAHLATLKNNRVLYVDAVESAYPLRMVGCVGSTNSLHCTALGKALLSRHSDEDIAAILLNQPMERRTELTKVTPAEYVADMQSVRRQGYALDEQESELQCRCVGAPIFDGTGNVVAAISVSGLVYRFSLECIEQQILPYLLKSTQEISQNLGYQP